MKIVNNDVVKASKTGIIEDYWAVSPGMQSWTDVLADN
jgi:hypothetical protein